MPEWVSDPFATNIWHVDGVAWYEATVPFWLHRCRAQTKAIFDPDGLDRHEVRRCACGGFSYPREGDRREYWIMKNSDRKRRTRPQLF